MLPILLLMTASLAQEAPEPEGGGAPDEPETVEMPSGPELPSALDDPSPVSLPGEDGGLADVLGDWAEQDRNVWSSGNFVRPSIALLVHEKKKPVALGLQAGRRWWQLKDGLRAGFELKGSADFGVASAKRSTDLGLTALGGPYLSFVGLQLGPGIGWSRWQIGRDRLAPAAGVDAVAMLVADLRLIGLYAGLAPRWLVSGGRRATDHNPLGLGDELGLQAGAAANLGGLRLGLGWTRRFTAIGPIDRYALNARLLLF